MDQPTFHVKADLLFKHGRWHLCTRTLPAGTGRAREVAPAEAVALADLLGYGDEARESEAIRTARRDAREACLRDVMDALRRVEAEAGNDTVDGVNVALHAVAERFGVRP